MSPRRPDEQKVLRHRWTTARWLREATFPSHGPKQFCLTCGLERMIYYPYGSGTDARRDKAASFPINYYRTGRLPAVQGWERLYAVPECEPGVGVFG